MIEITPGGWGMLALAAALIGVSKTGFTGMGILAVPLMAQAVDAKVSTGLLLPILVVGDIMAVAYYRRHAQWKYLLKLIPCAMVGIVAGWVFLTMVTSQQLKGIIGAVLLAILILNAWRTRQMEQRGEIKVPDGWWFAIVMGLLAGVTTMMANAAGPIMVVYLLAMRLPKEAFIGTGAWYFLILNLFKVPFSWNANLISPDTLLINAGMAPFVVVAGILGVGLAKRVPEKSFAWIVQILAGAGAALLMAQWAYPLMYPPANPAAH